MTKDEEIAHLREQVRLLEAEEERLLEDRRRDRAEIDELKARILEVFHHAKS